jgi:hypothetical protein
MSSIGSSTSDPGLPSISPIQRLRHLIENYQVENEKEIDRLAQHLLAEITSKRDESTDSLIARINVELVPKITESIPKIQAILSRHSDEGQRARISSNIENLGVLFEVADDLIKGRFPLDEMRDQFLAGKFANLDAIPLIKYLIINSENDSPIYADPTKFFNGVPSKREGEFVEILLSKNPDFIVKNIELISKLVYEPELIQILSKASSATVSKIRWTKFDLGQKVSFYLRDKRAKELSASQAVAHESKARKEAEHVENIDRFIRGDLNLKTEGHLIKELFKSCPKGSPLYSKLSEFLKPLSDSENYRWLKCLLKENPDAFVDNLRQIERTIGRERLVNFLKVESDNPILIAIEKKDRSLAFDVRLK